MFSYLHHVALRPPTRAMRFDDFLKVATLGFKCPSRMYDLYTLIKYSIDIFVIGISLCRGGGECITLLVRMCEKGTERGSYSALQDE